MDGPNTTVRGGPVRGPDNREGLKVVQRHTPAIIRKEKAGTSANSEAVMKAWNPHTTLHLSVTAVTALIGRVRHRLS